MQKARRQRAEEISQLGGIQICNSMLDRSVILEQGCDTAVVRLIEYLFRISL